MHPLRKKVIITASYPSKIEAEKFDYKNQPPNQCLCVSKCTLKLPPKLSGVLCVVHVSDCSRSVLAVACLFVCFQHLLSTDLLTAGRQLEEPFWSDAFQTPRRRPRFTLVIVAPHKLTLPVFLSAPFLIAGVAQFHMCTQTIWSQSLSVTIKIW